MPGINDSPEQVEEILRLCAEAGARSVGGIGLHLKGEVREIFLDWLRGTGRTSLAALRAALRARGVPAASGSGSGRRRLIAGARSQGRRAGHRLREGVRATARCARRRAAAQRETAPAAAGAQSAGTRCSDRGRRHVADRAGRVAPPPPRRRPARAAGGDLEREPVAADRGRGARRSARRARRRRRSRR